MLPRSSASPINPEDCNLARAIEKIGDRWTLLILRSALYGVRRFDDFSDELGAPRSVLSARLKGLVAVGILRKSTYKAYGQRARPEYVLTEMGLGLRPILIALNQWGDKWMGGDEQPLIHYVSALNRTPVKAGFIDGQGQSTPPESLRGVLRKPCL